MYVCLATILPQLEWKKLWLDEFFACQVKPGLYFSGSALFMSCAVVWVSLLCCSRDSDALTPLVPDGEFEELMNRNRAIASSAITKAVSGATAGETDTTSESERNLKYHKHRHLEMAMYMA